MSFTEKISLRNKNFCTIERSLDSFQRKFIVKTPDPLVRLQVEEEEKGYISVIKRLKDDEHTLFEVGKTFLFNGEPFLPKTIKKGKEANIYYLYVDILNVASLFLLPLLGGTSTSFRLKSSLVNSYVDYLEDAESSPCLYLLYRFESSKDFETLEDLLKGHSEYVQEFHPDQYHILYKFTIPKQYIPDYNLITESKYSQISAKAKVRILQFHGINPKSKTSPMYGILYKTKRRREKLEEDLGTLIPTDAELYQAFEPEKNIFIPNVISE